MHVVDRGRVHCDQIQRGPEYQVIIPIMSSKTELYTTIHSTKTRFHTLTYNIYKSSLPFQREGALCAFSFPLEECRWCLLEPPCEVKAKLTTEMHAD